MLNPDVFRREVGRLMLALDAAPNQREPDVERIEQLYEDVRHLDDYSFVIACDRCRKEETWFPKAKHILDRAKVVQRATGAIVDGESAWAAFEKRVIGRYSFGVTKAHDWPDPLTREIVREHLGLPSGGVHSLAMIENPYERDKYRKLFIRLYDERSSTAEATKQAVAQAEASALGPGVRLLGRETGD